MRRLLLGAALLMLTVPSFARAATTYTPGQYQAGGNKADLLPGSTSANPATGEEYIVHTANPAGISGSLGCKASGGQVWLKVTHAVTSSVSNVTVQLDDAVIGPYVYAFVTVQKDDPDGPVNLRTVASNQIVKAGDASAGYSATLTADFEPQASGTLFVLFGLQSTSSCLQPAPADLGRAIFSSVTIS